MTITIGQLARRCAVSADAIRFYERKGLLPQPERTPAGYRVYAAEHEERLHFIRSARAAGLTLADIAELIRLHDLRSPAQCPSVAERLRYRLRVLDRKVSELTAVRRRLRETLMRCEHNDDSSCPVVAELAELDRAAPAGGRPQRE